LTERSGGKKCIEMLERKNSMKMSSPSEASRYIFLATRPVLYQRAVQAKKTIAMPFLEQAPVLNITYLIIIYLQSNLCSFLERLVFHFLQIT